MNNNQSLRTHIQTDPNAIKHAVIGMCASCVGILLGAYIGIDIQIFLFIALPLLAGMGIEVIQKLALHGTNSKRETLFDALTTWVWVYSFYVLNTTR